MKLIVWLWNPGTKYVYTRHNAGFLVVDELVERYGGTTWLEHTTFDAHVSSGIIQNRQVLYVKPQTYMNRSGSSVRKIARYYDISPYDILVLHDDIDRQPQTTKLKYSGSHGGHNGLRDIIDCLGTKQFWRARLWVGRPSHPKMDVADYVLGRFSDDDLSFWQSAWVTDSQDLVEQWLKNVG